MLCTLFLMARTARIVALGMPHHIIQRGNRRMETFLRKENYGVCGDWERYLALGIDEEERLRIQQHSRTGHPLGDAKFIGDLEKLLGRLLHKRKPGPKTTQKKRS